MEIKHNYTNRFFLYGLLLAISAITFRVIGPYISVAILSFIVVSIFYPVHRFYVRKVKSEGIASILSVISVFVTAILPLIMFVALSIYQVRTFYNDINNFLDGRQYNIEDIVDTSNSIIDKIPYFEYEVTEEALRNTVEETIPFLSTETENQDADVSPSSSTSPNNNLASIANDVLETTVNISNIMIGIISDSTTKIIVFVYLLAALFPNYEKVLEYIKRISPFDDDVDQVYLSRFKEMSHAMVKGQLIIAIVQGVVSGLLLWALGVPYTIFLTLLMIFLSIIPLGAGMINIPVAIIFALQGNFLATILIFLNHFVVITNIDNILRPMLVPEESNLPGVLTLIAVFGGIQFFGFFGFIYGPVVVILFITTLEVFIQFNTNESLKN